MSSVSPAGCCIARNGNPVLRYAGGSVPVHLTGPGASAEPGLTLYYLETDAHGEVTCTGDCAET